MNRPLLSIHAARCLAVCAGLAVHAACSPTGGPQEANTSSGGAGAGLDGGVGSSSGTVASSGVSQGASGTGSGSTGSSSRTGGPESGSSQASTGPATSTARSSSGVASNGVASSGAATTSGSGPAGGSSSSGGTTTVSGGSCDAPIALGCNTGTLVLDTAAGSNAVNAYACDSVFTYPGRELVFAFSDAATADVTVSASKTGPGATTFQLFLLGGNPCTGGVSCLVSQDNTTAGAATAPLVFQSSNTTTTFLAYDVRGNFAAADTTTLQMTVACNIKRCGDGVIQPPETCDDGVEPPLSGDGCSASCQVEQGYACRGAPSTCHAITCGDGLLDQGEGCDDGDSPPSGNDGCSATCQLEPGSSCTGEPSNCSVGAGTCEDPFSLVGGSPFQFSSTAAAAVTANYGGVCGYHSFSGPEVYHTVQVPPGQAVRVSLSSAFTGARVVLADGCGASGGCQATSQSTVAWVNRSANAQTAYVVVDGALAADKGDYSLSAQVLAPTQFPPGDLCDTAVQLNLPATIQGDTTGFVSAVPKWLGACGYVGLGGRSGGGRDAFYRVTIPSGRTLRAVLGGVAGNIDSTLSLFTSCANASNSCIKDVDANSYGQGETLEYTNTSGVDLETFLAVDAIQDDRGTAFQLAVSLL